jgi:hypothetical protein
MADSETQQLLGASSSVGDVSAVAVVALHPSAVRRRGRVTTVLGAGAALLSAGVVMGVVVGRFRDALTSPTASLLRASDRAIAFTQQRCVITRDGAEAHEGVIVNDGITGGEGGIVKMTWAASDPMRAAKFTEYYFNASVVPEESLSGTDACWCDSCSCSCKISLSHESNTAEAIQVHFVNATRRPSGAISVADFEQQFSGRLHEMESFDPFMDFNVGVCHQDLGQVANLLQLGGVKFLALRWTTPEDGKEYGSLLVQVPGTAVVYELLGPTWSSSSLPEMAAQWIESVRLPNIATVCNFSQTAFNLKLARLSYPTEDAHSSAEWYSKFMEAGVERVLASDYETRVVVTLPSERHATIHLVQVHDTAKFDGQAADSGIHLTVGTWERYLQQVASEYMLNETYGFDQYMDFHFGYMLSESQRLSTYLEMFDSAAYRPVRYRAFNDSYGVYISAQSGQTIELVDQDKQVADQLVECRANGR